MDYKQKVRDIYPRTLLRSFPKYWAIEWFIPYEENKILGEGVTIDLAWKHAWDNIERQMLTKLES